MATKTPFVRITVARAVFLVIAVDAPRRARGRNMPIFLCRKRRAPASTLQNRPFQNPRFGALFSNGVEITVLVRPAEHRRKSVPGFWSLRIWKGCYPRPTEHGDDELH